MPEDSYILHTDASYTGIGGVLSVVREGQELPVAFFSRQLHPSEKNYSSSEIECLAVVDTVRHFEIHLVGKSFTLVTDHQALQYLASSRALNRRLTRWALFLQDFTFTIRYRPGKLNNNADGLTRQAWNGNSEKQVEDALLPEEGDVGNLT